MRSPLYFRSFCGHFYLILSHFFLPIPLKKMAGVAMTQIHTSGSILEERERKREKKNIFFLSLSTRSTYMGAGPESHPCLPYDYSFITSGKSLVDFVAYFWSASFVPLSLLLIVSLSLSLCLPTSVCIPVS